MAEKEQDVKCEECGHVVPASQVSTATSAPFSATRCGICLWKREIKLHERTGNERDKYKGQIEWLRRTIYNMLHFAGRPMGPVAPPTLEERPPDTNMWTDALYEALEKLNAERAQLRESNERLHRHYEELAAASLPFVLPRAMQHNEILARVKTGEWNNDILKRGRNELVEAVKNLLRVTVAENIGPEVAGHVAENARWPDDAPENVHIVYEEARRALARYEHGRDE